MRVFESVVAPVTPSVPPTVVLPVTASVELSVVAPVTSSVPAIEVLPFVTSTVNLFVPTVKFAPATSRPLLASTLPLNVT